jgi:hypothetical protein
MIGKDEVAGSNPAISSIKPVRNDWFSYAFGVIFASFGLQSCKLMTSSLFFVRISSAAIPETPCAARLFGHFFVSY